MKITGNSRATVESVVIDSMHVVRKTCIGEDSGRLLRQIEKQVSYECTAGIRTPEVLKIDSRQLSCEVTMEFVCGLDFVTFTNQSSYDDFENSVRKLVLMVKKGFEKSEVKSFPTSSWLAKIDSVANGSRNRGVSDEVLDIIKKFLIKSIPDKIPFGDCHGDLTFSNLIVERDGTICTFDFLDPPIETPYEDVSKLLQDTEFFWTLTKYTGQCDRTRVMIMWSHARRIILQELDAWLDPKILAMFQVMTLMRIIPYTSDESVIKYIVDCILRKVYEIDSTLRR